jgi:hypothetical protein
MSRFQTLVMPAAILVTKEEALAVLQKWKDDGTLLEILFDLTDEKHKSKLSGDWEGLAFSVTAFAVVRDLTSSALLLKTADDQNSMVVSLEAAVFGYVEPRKQKEALTAEELAASARIDRTLRIVLHQDAVLSLLQHKLQASRDTR